ncbi:unnamed protein product [Arabidopsis lyrata]|uniref:Uncharacterized protein n=1 Tax=Arabidopsis lyrata subsp. lyrata TaxID=81972 RepID=D7KK21_ARALL|nr:uncharacterized protein LOC9329232 [Arabidopsis lyrata subsp. lyrata]EFH69430.1 hypothetical protein ARALYDRAFT_889613 [Arabidopsis lyrata subsp. lyrata]CAH8253085.1 unnamed protein product [Arabidopsis lyrata]|eukprot:XP_002893171.1 uncharacterized protein LOC9329232 [Arabidopsis lyrata subsp. lyrata]
MSSGELKPFKKKEGSVIPKERELVKTKAIKAICSLFRPSCDGKQSSQPSRDGDCDCDGKRVYPTRP